MITYAQNFEDVILARLFGGRRSGFYVDVGAGDPVYLSITKWFYDLGWIGINIEPNRALHAKLVSERNRDINLAIGAGAARGDATFHEFVLGELSSFDRRVQTKAAAAGISSEIRNVAIVPLSEIIDQYAPGRHIDFLKIDVEGWEGEVLNGLDLQRHRPTVIVVESTLPETRIESHLEWEAILGASAFTCVYFDGLNRFYLPEERLDLRQHFAYPPNLFDEIVPAQVVEAKANVDKLKGVISLKDDEMHRLEDVNTATETLVRGQRAAVEALQSECESLRSGLAERDYTAAILRHKINLLARIIEQEPAEFNPEPRGPGNEETAIKVVEDATGILRSRKKLLRRVLALTAKSL
jgi:FkbM family methyltransferase